MVTKWMSTKIKYTKQSSEDGSFKRVTDTYVMQAYNFTECESNIHSIIGQSINGEFDVTAISRLDINGIVGEDSGNDIWYKVKISYMDIESKKIKETYLVLSSTVKEASEVLKNEFNFPFEVESVVKTPIVDVFETEKISAEM